MSPAKRKDDYMNFHLMNRRIELGLTCEQLARLTGLSSMIISHYESCRRFPSRKNQEIISEALNTKPEELFLECYKVIASDKVRQSTYKTGELIRLPNEYILEDFGIRLSRFEECFRLVAREEESIDLRLRRLEEACSNLKENEKKVLYLKFGKSKSYEEVGKIMGVSRQRAHQIAKMAMPLLRELYDQSS